MTIGLYDIDFFHGKNFSISLPLMKVYNRLYQEGHQVIMMKPKEKTGRFNKILYFKDNPKLVVPQAIKFNDKCKQYGYGFFKKSNLNDKTKEYAPSFMPYDLFKEKIKAKQIYHSIKNNNFIDWREKDFTYTFAGKTLTYVNDRDFLDEEDWKELFQHYDNNIEFIHSLYPHSFEQAADVLSVYMGKQYIYLPFFSCDEDIIRKFSKHFNVCFKVENEEELILTTFATKLLTNNPLDFSFKEYRINLDIVKWARSEKRESFQRFMGINYNEHQYLNSKYRLLLKQNPQTISYDEFKNEYLDLYKKM